MVMTAGHTPIVAESAEIDQLAALDRMLAGVPGPGPARLVGPEGEFLELPPTLYAVLLRAAHELAAGNGISVLPVEAMVTTQQAAEILNISRPHLIKMLEAGEMPYSMVGTHRRIRLQDLLAFKERQYARTQAALAELARMAIEDGTYDLMPEAR